MQVDLVERARTGDHDAFSRLVQLDGDRCYAIAIGILRDRERAQDAVQQAFMLAWRDLPSSGMRLASSRGCIDSSSARCYQEARRHRRWSIHVVTLPVEGPDEPGKGDSTVSVGERDALERAFVGLSPEHRAVVLLHHHIGWTLPEFAEILGVPLGTVKSRLYYATRLLRASIQARGAGDAVRTDAGMNTPRDPDLILGGMAGRERRPAPGLDATRDRRRHPGDPPTAAVLAAAAEDPNR